VQLTQAQRDQYGREGFLGLPGLFSPPEVAAMKGELRRIQGIDTDHLVRERSGGAAKAIYRVHEANGPTASPVFHAAARTPRLLQPAQRVLRDQELYVYHTKCNLKTAIDGSVWQWHQDYGSWRRDGVPAPDLTTALVMLDEPTEMSGCLYFIPGSHKVGNLEPEMDDRTTSYRLWVVPKAELLSIMERSPEPVDVADEDDLDHLSEDDADDVDGAENVACEDDVANDVQAKENVPESLDLEPEVLLPIAARQEPVTQRSMAYPSPEAHSGRMEPHQLAVSPLPAAHSQERTALRLQPHQTMEARDLTALHDGVSPPPHYQGAEIFQNQVKQHQALLNQSPRKYAHFLEYLPPLPYPPHLY